MLPKCYQSKRLNSRNNRNHFHSGEQGEHGSQTKNTHLHVEIKQAVKNVSNKSSAVSKITYGIHTLFPGREK
uniref:Uncharacterized protein n=1 Tax=Anguilla anguilla TaxID=7936 RepID=A0A0E9WMH3_ANGAN